MGICAPIDAARRASDLEGEVWATAPLVDLGFFAGEPDVARTAVERSARTSHPLGALRDCLRQAHEDFTRMGATGRARAAAAALGSAAPT